ncbi:MAG: hypothetical protein HOP07_17170 [Bacteriovoracaceae bacterium]|nr:hypothetical protein [Bacteriovoracaceae bacterium]
MQKYIKNIKSLTFLLTILVLTNKTFALTPIESLILGDFSERYTENETDPLNYVFIKELSLEAKLDSAKDINRIQLANYRAFYEEGKNLENTCTEASEIRFITEWEKTQAKRAMISTVQYIGLDLSTRAIAQYAKELEFSASEYDNLTQGLVANYCSQNLSIISKKELLRNLKIKFEKENSFKLPSVEKNPFFPENLNELLPKTKSLEQELLYTVKLFQSLCSWNGNPENLGLLVPVFKHSGIMAFFNRQMTGQQVGWNAIDNSLYLKEDNDTVQIACDNLICRKTSRDNMIRKYSYSLGGTSIAEDQKKLFCNYYRNAYYLPKESDPRLAQIMNQRTFDEENFINSQFIALITGIPDFLLRASNFNQGEDVLRSSMDNVWTKWAKANTENLSRELFFEEPLTLELVDQNQYYDFRANKLRVAFDVNLGEFDRTNQRVGKIRMNFKLNVQTAFLNYYRTALQSLTFKDTAEKLRLKNRFKYQISHEVKAAREKLIIPPWKGDLDELIVTELTSQILDTPLKFLPLTEKGMTVIDIEINYGVFALKYLAHQFKVQSFIEKSKLTQGK